MSSIARALPLSRARRTLRDGARALGLRRGNVEAARMAVERHTLARIKPCHDVPGRILCYHSVGTPAWGVNDVRPARFERQLHAALDSGYTFVPARELAGGGNRRQLAITFDDGVMSVLENAAPVLRDLHIPWALFIVAGWTEGRHAFGPGAIMGWEAVEKAAAMGATIGSHSMSHPRFASLSGEQARYELEESRRLIEQRLRLEVEEFAIPFGQSDDWSASLSALARNAGYERIYAQAQITRPPGTAGRSFVTRFDGDRVFNAVLEGRFDRWEEWTW